MADPWRHHFLAQMHQRGFADANGWLYYFDKTRPKDGVRHETPKPIFFEHDLYSSVDYNTGAKDTALETYYAQHVEDPAAHVIRKIVAAARRGSAPGLTPKEVAAWLNYWYFQYKRTPDAMGPVLAAFEAKLLAGKIDEPTGERPLAPHEMTIIANDGDRANILRNARVEAQSSPPAPFVKRAMASRGMQIVVIGDPRKAFVITSNPIVTLKAPGLTNPFDKGNEIWFPIASDVAVSPGGPPGAERLVTVTDHAAIRRLNEMMVDQSRQFAGRSKELVASLARRCSL